MFKISAERIGEADKNILYVGDRIDMDIQPSLKIGFKPVLKAAYTNAGKTSPDGAWKITSISELPALKKKSTPEYRSDREQCYAAFSVANGPIQHHNYRVDSSAH